MKKRWLWCLLGCLLVGCAKGPGAPTEGRITIGSTVEPIVADGGVVKIANPRELNNWSGVFANRSNNRPHTFLSEQPQLKTKTSIGKGVSEKNATLAGPIVIQNVIYTLDSRFMLQATELDTGKKLWRKELADITGTPAKSIGLTRWQKNLYAVAGNGLVLALDFDGNEVWRRELNTLLRSAATVDNGRLFVSSVNNEFFVLDAATGNSLWSYTDESATTNFMGMGTPAVSNTAAVMATTSGRVNVFDVETGVLLWTEDLWTNKTYSPLLDMTHITASPLIEGNVVYLIGNAGKSGAYLLDTGVPVFTVGVGGQETPVLSGSTLFMITNQGSLLALNKKNGKKYWETPLLGHGKTAPRWYGPVVGGTMVIVTSSDGDIIFFDIRTGKETSRGTTKALVRSPVLVGGAMLLMTADGDLLIYR